MLAALPFSTCRYLLSQGADPDLLTEDGETAMDLVEEDDTRTMAALLGEDQEMEEVVEEKEREEKKEEKSRKVSLGTGKEPAWVRKLSQQEQEPAWVRKLSQQEEDKDTRRKGSAWVGRGEIVEEEEEEEEEEGCDKEDKKDNGGSAVIEKVQAPRKEETSHTISLSASCENPQKRVEPLLTASINKPPTTNKQTLPSSGTKCQDIPTFRRLESYETDTEKAPIHQKSEEFSKLRIYDDSTETKKEEGGTEGEAVQPQRTPSDSTLAVKEGADSKKPLEARHDTKAFTPEKKEKEAIGTDGVMSLRDESKLVDENAEVGGGGGGHLEKSGSWRQRRTGMATIPNEGLIQGVRRR